MPVFIAKYNERMAASGEFGNEPQDLIGTIKVPKNLALLHDRLPASQYEGAQMKEIRNSPTSSHLKAFKQESSSNRASNLQEITEEPDFVPAVGPASR